MVKIQDGCINSGDLFCSYGAPSDWKSHNYVEHQKTFFVGSESHDVFPLVPYSKHMCHYKQHSPESTPFTMWQDLCVAAGHACRLAALVVQGSSTTAAMAEYGPVYSTFGERKRGAVYG